MTEHDSGIPAEPYAPGPDQQAPAQPPTVPLLGTPVAHHGPGAYAPPPASHPPRSNRWWILGVVLAILAVLGGCCALSLIAVGTFDVGGITTYGDTIALIHVDGVIAGSGGGVSGYVTPEDMLANLRAAERDPNVKAVLLRIDSPGGTVAASQEIATEIARLSEIKPVVASIGDVGASGAYMIASQCDEIVASPTSAVGSIGVITEIPNVAGLLEKLGVEFTVLTAGAYKDAGSPYRTLTATETALIQEEIDTAYNEFISIVAEGRDLPEAEVREMATGFAWSAIKGKKMGLVDTLGTYNDAVDRAAELGGIEGEPEVVSFDTPQFPGVLNLLMGASSALDRLDALVGRLEGLSGPAVPR